MVEVFEIEDFVINQIFRPYQPDFIDLPYESIEYKAMAKTIEQKLRRRPERIIAMLEGNPEAKERVFKRLCHFGGVKFYRYLNMDTEVIQYVRKELENGINREPKETDSSGITK